MKLNYSFTRLGKRKPIVPAKYLKDEGDPSEGVLIVMIGSYHFAHQSGCLVEDLFKKTINGERNKVDGRGHSWSMPR